MSQSDYQMHRILLEYKQLKEHAPSGVYIVPSLNPTVPIKPVNCNESRDEQDCLTDCKPEFARDYARDCITDCNILNNNFDEGDHGMNVFYGVIFLRRGMFRNAIFKFRISLPKFYNSKQTFPRVHFFTEVMNPYVDAIPTTSSVKGNDTKYYELNLRANALIGPRWDPNKHSLISVALCIKKIFYMKEFDQPKANPKTKDSDMVEPQKTGRGNYNAWLLWKIDFKGFEQQVHECADDSQRHVKDDKDSSVKFANKDEGRYQILRDLMKNAVASKRTTGVHLAARMKDFSGRRVSELKNLDLSKTEILDLVAQATTLYFEKMKKETIDTPKKYPKGNLMPQESNWLSRFSSSIFE